MKHHTLSVIAFVLGWSLSTQAASAPLITYPGYGPSVIVSNGATVGALFQVGPAALSVEALGMFDDVVPGLIGSHSVGLWSESGSLMARVDFPSGISGFIENGFIYQNLNSPVILQPGQRYVLGVDYPVGSLDVCRVNGWRDSETWSGMVSFVNGRYTPAGAGFEFPNADVFGLSYAGANARYNHVPEPSAPALLVLGAGALLLRGKLRPIC